MFPFWPKSCITDAKRNQFKENRIKRDAAVWVWVLNTIYSISTYSRQGRLFSILCLIYCWFWLCMCVWEREREREKERERERGERERSILMEVTRRPHALTMRPMLLAVTPLPRPLTTPPVTNTYFIFFNFLFLYLYYIGRMINTPHPACPYL